VHWSFHSHVTSTCVEVDRVVRKCLLIWYKNLEYSELWNLCQYCSLVIFYSWWFKFFGLFENLVSHFSLFQMKIMRTVLYRVGCLPYLFLNIEPCGKGHSIFVSLTLGRDFALEISHSYESGLKMKFPPPPTWCVVVCGLVGGCQHFIEMCCLGPYTVESCLQLCEDEDSTSLKYSISEALEFH